MSHTLPLENHPMHARLGELRLRLNQREELRRLQTSLARVREALDRADFPFVLPAGEPAAR